MCVEDKTCCPLYENIQKGKIPEYCEKCGLYKKINNIIFFSKIGLSIAAFLFILLTFIIY